MYRMKSCSCDAFTAVEEEIQWRVDHFVTCKSFNFLERDKAHGGKIQMKKSKNRVKFDGARKLKNCIINFFHVYIQCACM